MWKEKLLEIFGFDTLKVLECTLYELYSCANPGTMFNAIIS